MTVGKATKEHAEYRLGHDDDRCHSCTMYVPTVIKNIWDAASCTAVEGEISPHGLCNYFEREN